MHTPCLPAMSSPWTCYLRNTPSGPLGLSGIRRNQNAARPRRDFRAGRGRQIPKNSLLLSHSKRDCMTAFPNRLSTALRQSATRLPRTAGPVLLALRPLAPFCQRTQTLPFSTSYPLSVKRKMPPKKKTEEVKKVMLGRPGNNLKVCQLLSIRLCPGNIADR